MWKRPVRGLRLRWLRSGVLATAAAVLLLTAALCLGARGLYYGAVRAGLTERARSSAVFFAAYLAPEGYYEHARAYAAGFAGRDDAALEFIGPDGVVELTSHGVAAGAAPGTPDIAAALSEGAVGSWTGVSEAGERVMAVTAPLVAADGSVAGAMRFVTSLRPAGALAARLALLAAAVGLLLLAAVLLSNFYFIRTVTEPLSELTALSRRIAEGSYGIQAQKKHNDEIGDLTDAINEMSVKIGEAERVQTEFISSVSHELRTPLTAITGWSETLAYDDAIAGDSRRGVEIIAKESGRLTKMVEELLEFTRIQDGRFNLNVGPLDVAGALADAILTYGKLLEKEGVTVEYAAPRERIPLVLGDAERLKQVFLNLMDNAAKYGRAAGRIAVTIGATDKWVVIRFRDFGPGVPPEELPFITKKFYKGSGKERGSGIGLAVCDEIIARHKGRLELQNAADGRTGLIATVTLPVMNEQELTI